MTNSGLRSPRHLALLFLIAALSVLTAWLAFRVAAVQALPRGSVLVTRIAPDDLDARLDPLVAKSALSRTGLSPRDRALIEQAARRAPLDARPFLVMGEQNLRKGKLKLGAAQLERGQKLDPRQRLIHLFLLERYLRDGRYAEAATQFGVLARLVDAAQAPIADALAKMAVAPETREATRKALRTDPALESLVLAALARSSTDPAVVMTLASPAAYATATKPDGWGPLLVGRLVDTGRYGEAHDIWRRLYRVGGSEGAQPLYDAGLRGLPGSPPFNWTVAADTVGAVDLSNGMLQVEYYGRASGELASQMTTLTPGTYRFDFMLSGQQAKGTASLAWVLTCAGKGNRTLMTLSLPPATVAPRPVGITFTVPDDCPAQHLALTGVAGEFPTTINATVQGLRLQRVGGPAR